MGNVMTKQPAVGTKVRFDFTIPLLDNIRREGVAEVRYHTVVGTDLGCGLKVLESNHYAAGESIEVRVGNLHQGD